MNWIELDFFIIQPPCLEPLPSKAPAASLRGMAARAREDAGEGPLKNDGGKNACRNAHAFVKRWGLSWNIPFSYLDHIDDAGNLIKIPYVSPKSFLEFLLKKSSPVGLWRLYRLGSWSEQFRCFLEDLSKSAPQPCDV